MMEEPEKDHDRINELYAQMGELFDGEQILDAFYAIEKIVVNLLICNCISKMAAEEVIRTMMDNMHDMLDEMDAKHMAVWHNTSKIN